MINPGDEKLLDSILAIPSTQGDEDDLPITPITAEGHQTIAMDGALLHQEQELLTALHTELTTNVVGKYCFYVVFSRIIHYNHPRIFLLAFVAISNDM